MVGDFPPTLPAPRIGGVPLKELKKGGVKLIFDGVK
jgi:hypothetical protein